MPSVQDAINADRSRLTPIETPQAGQKPPAAQIDARVNSLLKSPYARCPLPPSNNSADSLRQWGQGSDVPMFRTQTPPTMSGSGGGSSTSTAVVVSSSSGGGGGTVTPTLPTAQTVNATTPTLAPGQTWQGTVQMAKGFLMQVVSGSAPCRVELYGNKTAQTLDLSRPITTPPASTTPAIIMDVALQSTLSWQVLDCVGSNGDGTVSATIYITITNLSASVRAISVTLRFVPEQS